MTVAGRDMDYDFGKKRHWRKTVWNQLLERSSGKDGVFLYLGAKSNYDKELLRSKGISPHDCICVDRSEDVVREVRTRGDLCLHGNIFDVLYGWNAQVPIRAANVDLCANASIITMGDVAAAIRFSMYPMSFNLLRGREGDITSKELIRNAKEMFAFGNTAMLTDLICKGNKQIVFNRDGSLGHRGFIVLTNIIMLIREELLTGVYPSGTGKCSLVRKPSESAVDVIAFAMMLMRPRIFSYRSESGQTAGMLNMSK